MKIDQLGPYRIIRELGRGGMGTVYEGVHVETDERVAVKLLAAPQGKNDDFHGRFAVEIDTLRRLNHPNIVRLFGFGDQDEHVFYSMELVDGNSLEGELQRGRRFDWSEVTRIGIDVCRALRHAHDRGVIHRDLKPGNLLLTAGDQVKLSDFGIARLFGQVRLTDAGNVVGTAEYMSPEQAGGRPVDPRSDLYSLGAVLYVMLSRRPLFRADSFPEMLKKQQFEQPEPIGRTDGDVPVALGAIVGQLLEKDPQARIPNAAVLARQLEEMQERLSLEADADADAEQPELPQTIDAPVAAESQSGPRSVDLLETKATAAFKEPEEGPGQRERKPAARFTPVAADELDRLEIERRKAAWISLQTWFLLAALGAVGMTVWYMLQSPTADALYGKIAVQSADGSIESLLLVEDKIGEFLARFPEDIRAQRLRQYEREIELYHLEQQFRRRTGRLAETESLAPVEQAYLEAINYARLDPERGMAKLEALIALYDVGREAEAPFRKTVELARRRLMRLREKFQQQNSQSLALIKAKLDRADELAADDPRRAGEICRAVIELYEGKPWAAKAVRRAREYLERIEQ